MTMIDDKTHQVMEFKPPLTVAELKQRLGLRFKMDYADAQVFGPLMESPFMVKSVPLQNEVDLQANEASYWFIHPSMGTSFSCACCPIAQKLTWLQNTATNLL